MTAHSLGDCLVVVVMMNDGKCPKKLVSFLLFSLSFLFFLFLLFPSSFSPSQMFIDGMGPPQERRGKRKGEKKEKRKEENSARVTLWTFSATKNNSIGRKQQGKKGKKVPVDVMILYKLTGRTSYYLLGSNYSPLQLLSSSEEK